MAVNKKLAGGAFVVNTKNSGNIGFRKDLLKLSNNFEDLTLKSLAKIMRRTGRAYVERYNKILHYDSQSRMKGASLKNGVSYKGKGKKNLTVTVNVNPRAKLYYIAKPHYVPLRINRVRQWVKAKWRHDGTIWRSTKLRAKKSTIYGPAIMPMGALYVTSYKSRHGGLSIDSQALSRSLDVLSMELKVYMNRFSTQVIRRFLKENYETKIFMYI